MTLKGIKHLSPLDWMDSDLFVDIAIKAVIIVETVVTLDQLWSPLRGCHTGILAIAMRGCFHLRDTYVQ